MESREDEEKEKMKGSETNPLCPTARTNTTKKHEHLAAVFRCCLFFSDLLPEAMLQTFRWDSLRFDTITRRTPLKEKLKRILIPNDSG